MEKIFVNYTYSSGLTSQLYKELKNWTSRKIKNRIQNQTESSQKLKHKWLINKKKCLTSLVIRKIKLKISLIFLLIPMRIAKGYKTNVNSYWWGCGLLVTPIHWWCKVSIEVESLWKSVWCFLGKLGRDILQDLTIPLMGSITKVLTIYPKYYTFY